MRFVCDNKKCTKGKNGERKVFHRSEREEKLFKKHFCSRGCYTEFMQDNPFYGRSNKKHYNYSYQRELKKYAERYAQISKQRS